jgi:DNA-directed RNA polymerase specialized sigma24 family protein
MGRVVLMSLASNPPQEPFETPDGYLQPSDEPYQTPAAPTVSSLERDAEIELLAMLAKHDYEGPLWDSTAGRLFIVGRSQLQSWMVTGQIWLKLREKKVRHTSPGAAHSTFGRHDAEDIASDAAERAVPKFQSILKAGRFAPDGRALLQTWFNTQCLFQFPNAFRRWEKANRPLDFTIDGEGSLEVTDPQLGPEERVVLRDQIFTALKAVPNDLARAAILLQVAGYTVQEIADLFGIKAKKVENVLARHRPTPLTRGRS